MALKETDITGEFLARNLSQEEYKKLKLFLGAEENYREFLSALLAILVKKEGPVPFPDFMELHGLAEKTGLFLEKQNELVEEIAELAFKGYVSEYTQWLQENNRAYTDHLAFLHATRKAIAGTERISLKQKLALLEKMKGFDLTEDEIKTGIKLFERNRLRQKLRDIAATERTGKKRTPSRLKLATLLVLIAASGAILAVSIPQVRNFIQKEFRRLFPEEKNTLPGTNTTGAKTTGISLKDTLVSKVDSTRRGAAAAKMGAATGKPAVNGPSGDSYPGKVPSNIQEKKIALEPFAVNEAADLKEYQAYFRAHRHALQPVESVWVLNGSIAKYPGNPVYLTCAIRKLEGDRYELVYFSPDGTKAKLYFKSVIRETKDPLRYELLQYRNDSLLFTHALSVSEKGVLKFSSHFVLGDFADIAPEQQEEQADCSLTGKRKK